MSRILAYVEGEGEPLVYPHPGSHLDTCAWCGKHAGIDYLELCSLLRTETEDYVLTWPGKGKAIAIVSHGHCGRGVGYGIQLDRLNRQPNFWREHIAKKRWDHEEYQEAFSYLAVRPMPSFDDAVLPRMSGRVHTYFVQSERGGPVKIGKSKDPASRLKGLQTGHPERLRIIKLIAEDIESDLHRKFAHLRGDGEWFRYTKELTDFLLDYQP